jgi:phage baseplate assembly protein W
MLKQTNLYSDLNFFISKNPFTNDFAIKKDQNAIKQSIKNIVLTAIGERPFDKTFGTTIYNSLFELPYLIEFYCDETIRLAINKYEPRIKIEDITYETDNQEVVVSISIYITSLNIKDKVIITLERTR